MAANFRRMCFGSIQGSKCRGDEVKDTSRLTQFLNLLCIFQSRTLESLCFGIWCIGFCSCGRKLWGYGYGPFVGYRVNKGRAFIFRMAALPNQEKVGLFHRFRSLVRFCKIGKCFL